MKKPTIKRTGMRTGGMRTSHNSTARSVWLAGLGAVSMARQQGQRIVTALVAEGEQISERGENLRSELSRNVKRQVSQTQRQVKGVVKPWVQQAGRVADDVSASLGERLGNALGRLGVPTKVDLGDLSRRLDGVRSALKSTRSTSSGRRPAAKPKLARRA